MYILVIAVRALSPLNDHFSYILGEQTTQLQEFTSQSEDQHAP